MGNKEVGNGKREEESNLNLNESERERTNNKRAMMCDKGRVVKKVKLSAQNECDIEREKKGNYSDEVLENEKKNVQKTEGNIVFENRKREGEKKVKKRKKHERQTVYLAQVQLFDFIKT